MVTNLAYFYETSRKVRGGKWVWVKDSNGEARNNVLLGGTILNAKKGFDHLYAAQLVQYTPGQGCLIFRSFSVLSASGKTIYIKGDGYSDAPEKGMLIMKAPTTATATGQSALVESVTFIENDSTLHQDVFKVEVDETLTLTPNDILVEAGGTEASATATVLVSKPNTFVEADRDLMPTDGYGLDTTSMLANYSISTVYNKQAWIARMQPLPQYVLANNRSLIDGIFWI